MYFIVGAGGSTPSLIYIVNCGLTYYVNNSLDTSLVIIYHLFELESYYDNLMIDEEEVYQISMKLTVPEIVKTGDTVTLTCKYDLEEAALYTIKWYMNEIEFFRFVPKESPPFKAFSLPHANLDISNSGPTQVTFTDVTKEMTADYSCEVSADAPWFHTDIKTAHLTVAELPTGGPTLNIEPGKVEIGKKINAECQSPSSFPVANLTWYINNEKIMENSESIKMSTLQIGEDNNFDLQSSVSKIEIIANQSHFAMGWMTLKCEASINSLWSKSIDATIRDESPLLAPVLGSTSSQSVEDSTFDIFTGNGCGISIEHFNALVIFLTIIQFLVKIR